MKFTGVEKLNSISRTDPIAFLKEENSSIGNGEQITMLRYDGGLAIKWGAALILISLMINSKSRYGVWFHFLYLLC